MSYILKPVLSERMVCAGDGLPPSLQGEFFQEEVNRKFTFSDANHQGLDDGFQSSLGPVLSPSPCLWVQCIY